MNLTPHINLEAQQLIEAVEVALSPSATLVARNQAYSLYEKFKEQSPICAAVGLQLAGSDKSATVRHFGLQLVEHCIKFRWKDLPPQEKLFLKQSVWELLEAGNNMSEATYIKDGTARLVVEMAKREWPQQWPNFLEELTTLARDRGPYQIEIVLLVLLRLVEDVAIFQTVEPARRRDLYQALTANMSDIFEFLSRLLIAEVNLYQEHLRANAKEAEHHCRLAQSVLAVLQVLVDWVPIAHVMAHNGQLLVHLCSLLSEENLRLAAAECLLQVVSRKGSSKDRKPLLILFSPGAISAILAAAELASSKPMAESNYNFLKRLSEVLAGLGVQLCTLYGKEPDVEKPATFQMYLQALLALMRHSSLSINQSAASVWVALFRHERLSTELDLQSAIEPWVEVAARKFIKTEPCPYSQLDFDSDEEFNSFFNRLRTDLLDAARLATVIAPHITFASAQNWLLSVLNNPATPLAEWEAVACFLDAVVSKAKEAPTGPQLLERCLTYQTSDPLIFSEFLSCVSALFTFVQHDPQRLLQPALERIFTAVLYIQPGETFETRSKTTRLVRRHACSLMVKISLQQPSLLVQCFSYLQSTIDQLGKTEGPSKPSRMEIISLYEALLIISNQFNNFQMQSEFISQYVRPTADQWASFGTAFNSAPEFMAFIGLDKAPVAQGNDDPFANHRLELMACTSVFLGVLKRCKAPEGSRYHPAGQALAPILYHTFRLARVLHQVYEPEAKQLLNAGFSKAYDLLESEVNSILTLAGMTNVGSDVKKEPTPVEKMQGFLVQLHTNVYSILGSMGEAVGEQYFSQPGLSMAVAGTACYGHDHLPDHRLRVVLRNFCRPFITSCPAHLHRQVLLPFLAHLFPAMLNRLSSRWQEVMQQTQVSNEDRADLQEIIRDVIIRQMSKDFLDIIRSCLLTSVPGNQQVDDGDEVMDGDAQAANHPMAVVSELGKMILADPSVAGSFVQCLCSLIWWADSQNSTKTSSIFETVLRYWMNQQPGQPFPPKDIASYCMSNLLNGLQVLGQHEGNLASLVHLGVVLCDTFLPVYPDAIAEVLMRQAGTRADDIREYQEKMASLAAAGGAPKATQKVEKVKRDLFKKMTQQVVGQSLADLFRKPVHLTTLPKMGSLKPRQKAEAADLADVCLADLFIQE